MVTTTNDDELPTHDVYGTDLARVRDMHERGFSHALIAECLGIDKWKAQYAVVVATGDREGSPEPGEIAAALLEIQGGWSEEMAIAARRGLPRNSSLVVRPAYASGQEKRQRAHARIQEQRITDGVIPIKAIACAGGRVRHQARVEIQVGGKRFTSHRSFETREEAEAWGREWLRKLYEARQAGACVGK